MVRLFRHYVPRFILVVGAVEALILFGAFWLGVVIQSSTNSAPGKILLSHFLHEAGLYTFLMMTLLAAMGLYERGLRDQLPGVFLRVATAFIGGVLLIHALMAIQPNMLTGETAIFAALAISGAGLLSTRTLFYHLADRPFFKRRVMVVGAGRSAAQLQRLRRRSDWQSSLLIGYLPVRDEEPYVNGAKLLSRKGTLCETANWYGVNQIVVAFEDPPDALLVADLLDCKLSGIEVVEIATFLERVTGKIKLETLTPSGIVFADGFVQALRRGFLHRIFDAVVSLLFLVVTLPIMLATALAIYIESGGQGPILYKQCRVGRQGQRFQILKFRSMRVDAEKDGTARWAVRNDARITRIGALIRRARIDELPQLLNVLKGEMSFVGPRPERPEFVAKLSEMIPYYYLRHCVSPGLTGWAQIRYPYGASEEDAREKLQYDLYYVKNYSLFLDLTILLQTAQVVLWGKGAR